MNKYLGIAALVFLTLAAGSVILWMASLSAIITGGGRSTSEAEGLLTFAQISVGLFCLVGISSLIFPGKKKSSTKDSSLPQ